jgi:hypothetical protein
LASALKTTVLATLPETAIQTARFLVPTCGATELVFCGFACLGRVRLGRVHDPYHVERLVFGDGVTDVDVEVGEGSVSPALEKVATTNLTSALIRRVPQIRQRVTKMKPAASPSSWNGTFG